jgi:hypothetical protein
MARSQIPVFQSGVRQVNQSPSSLNLLRANIRPSEELAGTQRSSVCSSCQWFNVSLTDGSMDML